jgi:hypothetical protein
MLVCNIFIKKEVILKIGILDADSACTCRKGIKRNKKMLMLILVVTLMFIILMLILVVILIIFLMIMKFMNV